jgi:hypothetical protein
LTYLERREGGVAFEAPGKCQRISSLPKFDNNDRSQRAKEAMILGSSASAKSKLRATVRLTLDNCQDIGVKSGGALEFSEL